MEQPKLVLIVGSPRSGTTWLQSLLGAHPSIATPQETDLFRLYLEPLAQAWDAQVSDLREVSSDRRRKGLPTVLTRAQFDALGREFAATLIESVSAHKPSTTVVVEKSPGHSLCTDVVQRFWGEAGFIHLIRDGRDVAASLVAASQTFGHRFAPSDVTRAARLWGSRVRGAQSAATAAGGYLEIRYEELHHSGSATLQRAFQACGVEATPEECVEILGRFDFAGMADAGSVASSIITGGEFADDPRARSEPEGFFRRGVVGGWRDEWSFAERHAFDAAAGELLVDLGYEPDRGWVGTGKVAVNRRATAAHRAARLLRKAAARFELLAGDT